MESGEDTDAGTPYHEIGGQARVRAVVERFYDLIDADPAFAHVRGLYPASLVESRDKLFWFLSGWLGGPALYLERVGQPMLRARHQPFSIGVVERDEWLTAMARAMADAGVPKALGAQLSSALFGTADWMRNRNEPAD
jgi:hemoglobin